MQVTLQAELLLLFVLHNHFIPSLSRYLTHITD
ncbi:hypothetical protein [Staphylococcus phage PT94]